MELKLAIKFENGGGRKLPKYSIIRKLLIYYIILRTRLKF